MLIRMHKNIRHHIFRLSIAVMSLGMVVCVLPAAADIYLFIDDRGVLHFTNVPTSSNYRVYIREKPEILNRPDRRTRYDRHIRKASKLHGIDFPLLKSIIKVESDFNPRAVSNKGAMGLMQIMPQNLKKLNLKNPFDPHENIMAGTRYLKKMLNRFGGRLPLALAAYHAGPTAVERHKAIPPIRSTQAYVRKVMQYYYIYKKG